jgi:hypothetical protein
MNKRQRKKKQKKALRELRGCLFSMLAIAMDVVQKSIIQSQQFYDSWQ